LGLKLSIIFDSTGLAGESVKHPMGFMRIPHFANKGSVVVVGVVVVGVVVVVVGVVVVVVVVVGVVVVVVGVVVVVVVVVDGVVVEVVVVAVGVVVVVVVVVVLSIGTSVFFLEHSELTIKISSNAMSP